MKGAGKKNRASYIPYDMESPHSVISSLTRLLAAIPSIFVNLFWLSFHVENKLRVLSPRKAITIS